MSTRIYQNCPREFIKNVHLFCPRKFTCYVCPQGVCHLIKVPVYISIFVNWNWSKSSTVRLRTVPLLPALRSVLCENQMGSNGLLIHSLGTWNKHRSNHYILHKNSPNWTNWYLSRQLWLFSNLSSVKVTKAKTCHKKIMFSNVSWSRNWQYNYLDIKKSCVLYVIHSWKNLVKLLSK